MKPSSAKAKGRRFQQRIRDDILDRFKSELELDDVRSTSMGAPGEDIMLSPKARSILPITIECKSVKSVAAARYYDQAAARTIGRMPVAVFKEDHGEPLAIVAWEHLLDLLELRHRSVELMQLYMRRINEEKEGEC